VWQAIYLEKLKDETRIRWVERAISRVTDMQLRVRYVLVDDMDSIQHDPVDNLSDDPVIQEGLGLGGQIREDEE
jgi:hypothetical protein